MNTMKEMKERRLARELHDKLQAEGLHRLMSRAASYYASGGKPYNYGGRCSGIGPISDDGGCCGVSAILRLEGLSDESIKTFFRVFAQGCLMEGPLGTVLRTHDRWVVTPEGERAGDIIQAFEQDALEAGIGRLDVEEVEV